MPGRTGVGRVRRRARLPGSDVRSARRVPALQAASVRRVAARGRARWCATARRRCPKAAGTRFRDVYADGALIAGDAGGLHELDAAEGHPPRDADRACSRPRRRSTPSAQATRRRRALQAYRDGDRRQRRAARAVSRSQRAPGVRLRPARGPARTPGSSLVTGGWWVRDPMPAHAGYERMRKLADYYRDGRPDPERRDQPGRRSIAS